MALDQQVSDRDYREELERGLSILFGEYFLSYDLRMERNHHQIFMMGNYSPVYTNSPVSRYTLTINIEISVSECIKSHNLPINGSMFQIERSPIKVERYQDLSCGKVIMKAEYVTDNLDKFLDKLKEKTWGKFERDFTEQLESKLDTEDTN